MADQRAQPENGQGMDAALLAVLEQLWRAAGQVGQQPWSLARLAKQSGLPMSVLRRQLSYLQAAGVVQLQLGEDGRGSAGLSADGLALCREMFAG
ncbi:helix-turn-helix domain-containing protein [Aquitalea denitrificans]|uniref:helix-turn-helix domain-containing protein n=1 Tax=Aquitalea denitrificans TaxID=519081 RepID=UPI00196A5E6D|nr:helix-turn-helix domain-containing protein [Aquitalea denitrificans]